MILPDTTVWVDYFNGIKNWQSQYLDSFLQNEPVLIGDLIFAEILQGFRHDKDFQLAKNSLDLLPFVNIGGYEVVLQSASNYRLLRKRGVTVRKTIDVIIATYCIFHEHHLLHNDHDFEVIETHFPLKIITNS